MGSGTVALTLPDKDGRMFKDTYANGRFDPVRVLDILHLHESWRETHLQTIEDKRRSYFEPTFHAAVCPIEPVMANTYCVER